jgi:Tfp pilus assembly protein PilV
MLPAPPSESPRAGSALLEVLIAATILSVGLMSLAASGAVMTRMMSRAHRSADAAAWAVRRTEDLRSRSCASIQPGQEDVMRGSTHIGRLTWTVRAVEPDIVSVVLVSRFIGTAGVWRSDTLETRFSCVR